MISQLKTTTMLRLFVHETNGIKYADKLITTPYQLMESEHQNKINLITWKKSTNTLDIPDKTFLRNIRENTTSKLTVKWRAPPVKLS